MITDKVRFVFDKVVDVVFSIILIFIVLGIVIGTIELCITEFNLLEFKGIAENYTRIITDVLTLYVLIELSRSLVEYFSSNKLRLTFIVDAAIVFIIREILIDIFEDKMTSDMLYAFSTILFVLGALRIGSVLVFQRERNITQHVI